MGLKCLLIILCTRVSDSSYFIPTIIFTFVKGINIRTSLLLSVSFAMDLNIRTFKKQILLKIKRVFKLKKGAKKRGYKKLISDEERRCFLRIYLSDNSCFHWNFIFFVSRWLDAYAARTCELPSRIGIPYYD